MNLVQLLVSKGVLRETDVPALQAAQKGANGKPLHSLVIDSGFAKEEEVLPVLADHFGMELVDLTKVAVQPDTLKSMPTRLVHRRSLMPLSRENGTLTVATGDPFDVYAIDELQTLTGLNVHAVLASPREINRLIKTHFGVGGETVTAMVQDRKEDVELLEELEGDDSELAKMAQEASVVKLVNEILVEAANERASDIHIEPAENSLRIRYRIDGLLQTQPMPQNINRFQPATITPINTMSPPNITPT